MSHIVHANSAIHQFLSLRHSFIFMRSTISTVVEGVAEIVGLLGLRVETDWNTNIIEANSANIDDNDKVTDPSEICTEHSDKARRCNRRKSERSSTRQSAPKGITA
jgi:hypothetical protein